MKSKYLLILIVGYFLSDTLNAQSGVIVATNTASPDPSAMLEVKSSTKGILIPTMTSLDRENINTPRHGLMVFVDDAPPNDSNDGFYYYDANSGSWLPLGGSSLWIQEGNNIVNSNSGAVVINGNDQRNEIYFKGTVLDNQADRDIHTAIVERIYEPTERSELLFFKGNDADDNNGPDRIRYDAVGAHIFQVGKGPRYYDPNNVIEGETVLTINAAEQFIIGTDPSWGRFQVYKNDPRYTDKEIGAIAIRNTSNAIGSRNYLQLGVDANEINAMWEDGSGGNLHINYGVGGKVYIGGHDEDVKTNLSVNGSVFADNLVYSSDRRLKSDIQPINDAMSLIKESRGVTYHRNGTPKGKIEYGMIAQEVEQVIPALVSERTIDQSKRGLEKAINYKSYDPIGYIAILVEAVKSQQQEIDQLNARLAEIERLLKERK